MSASAPLSDRTGRPIDLAEQLDAAAAHYAAGRLAEAAYAYTVAAMAAPDDTRALSSLGVINIRLGRLEDAATHLERVVRIDPNLAAAHHNLGYVRQRLGHWAEAAAAYGRAVACDPDAAASRLNLAIALAATGRVGEAVDQYRRLAVDPARQIDALTRLALLAPGQITDQERDDLSRLVRAVELGEEARIGLLFALGGVLDTRAASDAAFEAYAEGNRLKRRALARSGADPAMVDEQNERAANFIRTRLNADFLAQQQTPSASSVAPIFIVGFPRSGSTLIEHILASHPQAQGMGESPALTQVLTDRFPYAGAPRDAGHFRDLADAYLTAQKARGWDGRSRLVDKTLENYLHVGVIALMFPRAVILHSLRDAADTGFACFRQLFVAGNETLYDLTQIGEEYVRYRGIMNHWDQALPGRVIQVSHEALVAAPDAQIRWLVTEACGLDWRRACLRFDRAERGVTTASGAQVRRPIFTTSVGRWRAYAKPLRPMLDALGSYAPTEDLTR